MAKTDWGLKRACLQCGALYYDMRKKPPVCPKCGAIYDPESLNKTRRSRGAVEDKARRPAPLPAPGAEDVPVADGDEAEGAVIEDADELGEDMDVDEVVDVEETEGTDEAR